MQAFGMQLAQLDGDPPAAEVVAGLHDQALQPQPLQEGVRNWQERPVWWRISFQKPLPANLGFSLVLAEPRWTRLQSWIPGASSPVEHALAGPLANPEHTGRAFFITLPDGLPAGEPIWIRMPERRYLGMPLALETASLTRKRDVEFVAWRSIVLTTLAISVMLAMVHWLGTREASFVWLAATLLLAFFYLLTTGGDARLIPVLGPWLHGSFLIIWVLGALVLFSISMFLCHFLDLPSHAPRLTQVIRGLMLAQPLIIILVQLHDRTWVAVLGNFLVIALIGANFFACLSGALRGSRQALILAAALLPLGLFTLAYALQAAGFLPDLELNNDGMSIALALSALLTTLLVGEKLTQLRRARDTADGHAYIDGLTGVLNRRAIEQQLHLLLKQAAQLHKPLSIALLDVDRFKEINDSYGHLAGDDCLRKLAACTSKQLRTSDLLGRYGGDEALLLMPATDIEGARVAAERILMAVRERKLICEGHEIPVTLSIGIAQWRQGEGVAEVIARADAALYASKKAGRNCVHVG